MSHDLIDSLKHLHTHAVNARKGYEEALDDAGGKGLTPLFRQMIALHAGNAQELAAALNARGETASPDGSFLATVHRTIISIRSLFGGLDESVLPGLIDGEDRNVKHYTDVLNATDTSADLRPALLAQRQRLEYAIVQMHAAET